MITTDETRGAIRMARWLLMPRDKADRIIARYNRMLSRSIAGTADRDESDFNLYDEKRREQLAINRFNESG